MFLYESNLVSHFYIININLLTSIDFILIKNKFCSVKLKNDVVRCVFLGEDTVYRGVYNTSRGYIVSVFYVLLTVHFGMILVNNKFDAQFFSCMFISILYMFRAAMCLSSVE